MSKLTSDEAEVAGSAAEPSGPAVEGSPEATEPVRDETGSAPVADGIPASASRPRPSRITLLTAGLGVLLVALWVGGGLLLAHNLTVGRADAERAPALAAAQKVAADLTSISTDDVQQRVQGLIGESTGEFHKQISTYASALQTVLSQVRVGSRGTVSAGGIERIDQKTATALVTVTGSVSGGVLPDAQPISFRLAVTMQHENGRWLASDVTFVK
jgi:Mce-associated membrane protein